MEMCANAANSDSETHATSFPVESTGHLQTDMGQVAEVPTIFTSSISQSWHSVPRGKTHPVTDFPVMFHPQLAAEVSVCLQVSSIIREELH